MDAFDADVIIYAATPGHVLGAGVRSLFSSQLSESAAGVGIGSVLLLPEVLSKPIRDEQKEAITRLAGFLSRLTLLSLDEGTAELATTLAASYDLRAADAVHLATAVAYSADRFITNNRDDFSKSISEIDVTYPEELSEHPRE